MAESSAFSFERIDERTKEVTPALICAVVECIVAALHPRQVILFGSQISGISRHGSDIDLLICLEDGHRLASLSSSQRASEVLNLFRYRSFGLDVIVLTEDELRHLRDTNEGEWDLVLEILEQGKVLYEQPSTISSQ